MSSNKLGTLHTLSHYIIQTNPRGFPQSSEKKRKATKYNFLIITFSCTHFHELLGPSMAFLLAGNLKKQLINITAVIKGPYSAR